MSLLGATKKNDAAGETSPLKGESKQAEPSALPWIGQIVAGTAIMIDVLFNNGQLGWVVNYGYALFTSIIAICAGLVGFLLIKNQRWDNYNAKILTLPQVGDVSFGTLLAAVMLVFWSIAVGLLTFWSPYVGLGNGFIATWLGAVSSAYAAGVVRQARERSVSLGPVFWLLVASVVVLLALLPRVYQWLPWARALGFATSAVSTVLTLLVLLADQGILNCVVSDILRSTIFLWLAILWIITSLILTYRGPFTSGLTANGFLGSWSALAFAIRCSSQTAGPIAEAAKARPCSTSKQILMWAGGILAFLAALALVVIRKPDEVSNHELAQMPHLLDLRIDPPLPLAIKKSANCTCTSQEGSWFKCRLRV